MPSITEILRGRTDLSAFVVHLTRGPDPQANIQGMLASGRIEARRSHGWNLGTLEAANVNAVCFTATPLEFLSLLCGDIENREVELTEWGLAFGKYQARLLGANPVQYAHGYPNQGGGSHQPANALDVLRSALEAHLDGQAIMQPPMRMACETLLSYASKMRRQGNVNEWWWEREWRKLGHFTFDLAHLAFGLAPRDRILEMEQWAQETLGHPVRFLCPAWTIEEALGHLADLPEDEPPWPQSRY